MKLFLSGITFIWAVRGIRISFLLGSKTKKALPVRSHQAEIANLNSRPVINSLGRLKRVKAGLSITSSGSPSLFVFQSFNSGVEKAWALLRMATARFEEREKILSSFLKSSVSGVFQPAILYSGTLKVILTCLALSGGGPRSKVFNLLRLLFRADSF